MAARVPPNALGHKRQDRMAQYDEQEDKRRRLTAFEFQTGNRTDSRGSTGDFYKPAPHQQARGFVQPPAVLRERPVNVASRPHINTSRNVLGIKPVWDPTHKADAVPAFLQQAAPAPAPVPWQQNLAQRAAATAPRQAARPALKRPAYGAQAPARKQGLQYPNAFDKLLKRAKEDAPPTLQHRGLPGQQQQQQAPRQNDVRSQQQRSRKQRRAERRARRAARQMQKTCEEVWQELDKPLQLSPEDIAAGGVTGYARSKRCRSQDWFARKLHDAKEEVLTCERVLQNPGSSESDRQCAQACLNFALVQLWGDLAEHTQAVVESLSVDNVTILTKGRQRDEPDPFEDYLHSGKQLDNALGLLHVIISRVTDTHVLELAVRQAFSISNPFINFERSDLETRTTLVRWGQVIARTLCQRKVEPCIVGLATGALMRWLHCLGQEHIGIVRLLDAGFQPTESVRLGYLDLPAVQPTPPAGGVVGLQGAQGAAPVADGRMRLVRGYHASLIALLTKTLEGVQVLSATLGSASRDLIHTGLLTLCDVTQDVDTDVRHTALLTFDRVLAEARTQIRPGQVQSTPGDAKQQAQMLASDLVTKKVLSHLLLLVAVSVPALSCKLEDWRAATAAALPAYTHFLTPQQTLADFTWQMKRDAVSGRVKRSMEKSGRLAFKMLGAVFGLLVDLGHLEWRVLLQVLTLCPSTTDGALHRQTAVPLRAYTLAMLNSILHTTLNGPTLPPTLAQSRPELAACALRTWVVSLLDSSCRAQAFILSKNITRTHEVRSIVQKACDQLTTDPALRSALGPYPTPHTQPGPPPQVPIEPTHVTLDSVMALIDQLNRDEWGEARAMLLACVLIGLQLAPEHVKLWLEDIDQMWDLCAPFDAPLSEWHSVMTSVTLRALRVPLVLIQRQGLRLAPQMLIWPLMQRLAYRCCRSVINACVRVAAKRNCTGRHGSVIRPLLITSLQHSTARHLHSCLSLCLSMLYPPALFTGMQPQAPGQPPSRLKPAPPMHMQMFELLCLGTQLPQLSDLLPGPDTWLGELPCSSDMTEAEAMQAWVAQTFLDVMFGAISRGGAEAAGPGLAAHGTGGVAVTQDGLSTPGAMGRAGAAAAQRQGMAGAVVGGSEEAAWRVLHWFFAGPVHGAVMRALPGVPAPTHRTELDALTTVRFVRVLFQDPRLRTDNALARLLPLLACTTVNALNTGHGVGPPASTPVLVSLHALWQQLLKHLYAAGLLKAPEPGPTGRLDLRQKPWEGALAQPDLQRVVQTLMRAFCYRTIITALELGKPDRAAAMGRVRSLKPVKEGDPKAWEDMGMHEAYYQIKCLLGNPWALTPMESNALGAARNSVLAAGTVARAAATHPTNHPTNPLHNRTLDEPLVPAGDCHFKLLEAQLAFLCQLMAVGDAAEYPGFTWGAYVLPALHAVLLEGPDCGVLLDRGIAAQLQRVVEQEARLRIAAGCGNVAAPSQAAAPSQNIAAPSSKLWEQKTLLVHQALAEPLEWTGCVVGVCLMPRMKLNNHKGITGRCLHFFERQDTGLGLATWTVHSILSFYMKKAIDTPTKAILNEERKACTLEDWYEKDVRESDLLVVRAHNVKRMESKNKQGVWEPILTCSVEDSVTVDPPDIAPLVQWLKANALEYLRYKRQQLAAARAARPPVTSVAMGPAARAAQPRANSAPQPRPQSQPQATAVSSPAVLVNAGGAGRAGPGPAPAGAAGPRARVSDVHITQHVRSGTAAGTTQAYSAVNQ